MFGFIISAANLLLLFHYQIYFYYFINISAFIISVIYLLLLFHEDTCFYYFINTFDFIIPLICLLLSFQTVPCTILKNKYLSEMEIDEIKLKVQSKCKNRLPNVEANNNNSRSDPIIQPNGNIE